MRNKADVKTIEKVKRYAKEEKRERARERRLWALE